jgi:YkoY family integral membrane protein
MPFDPSGFLALAQARLFGQTFEVHDLFVVALLCVLEGVLSIDNALVLGLLARRLPKHLQNKALTFGLLGALVFRVIAIGAASFLLRWTFAKFLGGAYLLYVAARHFLVGEEAHADHEPHGAPAGDGATLLTTRSGKPLTLHSWRFWQTVIVIELTDIAFAVDSIVAAIALVGQQKATDTGAHDKLWVVVVGGMIGVILMRFAAVLFIKLLERFPRFETAAYLLVGVIAAKLLVDWWFNTPDNERVNFHSPHSVAFWVFWVTMLVCFCVGFMPRRAAAAAAPQAAEEEKVTEHAA